MQKMMMLLVAILGNGMTHAQTNDLSWTFQWGTNTAGIVFEVTNLTTSVKIAIRDDIKLVWDYQFHSQASTTNRLYVTDDEEFGKYTGHFWFEKDMACPEDIRGLDYNVYGGTNYYFITEEVCSNYVAQITLTNKHSAATMGSLSNFLHTVNNVSVGTTTHAEFAELWWRFSKGRAGILADDTPEEFTSAIQSKSEYRHVCLSILDVWEKESSVFRALVEEPAIFGCNIYERRKSAGNGDSEIEWIAVFKEGKWRLVAWD